MTADPGWHRHAGGPCPVDPQAEVEVGLRSEQQRSGKAENFWWAWAAFPSWYDVMRWRYQSPPRNRPPGRAQASSGSASGAPGGF